jgi:bacteriocin biosynthesis cyclodehydratase domain-containing protein
VHDEGRVLIEHAGTLVTLEGAAVTTLLPRLLPLLDGTRTNEELVVALGPAVAPAVENALALLAENRLLVDGPSTDDDGPASSSGAYAAALTRATTPSAAVGALETGHVCVLGLGACATELSRQLATAGVGRVEQLSVDAEPPHGSFVTAAPEHTETDALPRVNERALGCGDPWLQVLPYDGRFVVAGPVFVPGSSGCRACFATRRAATSGYEEDFDLVDGAPQRAPCPAPLASIAAALATVLVVRWLTTFDPTLPGRFYALECGTIVRLRFDRLLRVPRCASCGTPVRAVPSPWHEAIA